MLASRVLELLSKEPGLSDREITDRLFGPEAPQQPVNQTCRRLEQRGMIARRDRPDGRIGNYSSDGSTRVASEPLPSLPQTSFSGDLAEDSLKHALQRRLEADGWRVIKLAMGKSRGADIEASRGAERWVIEVKGLGSLPAMRVNYFVAILGELLQRMDAADAKYSIALPDVPQFRGLWKRLPVEAKRRTHITALFVDVNGAVTEDGLRPDGAQERP